MQDRIREIPVVTHGWLKYCQSNICEGREIWWAFSMNSLERLI